MSFRALSSELGEQAFRILMVNLFEDWVRQLQTVDFPSTLIGRTPVVEVFVGGIEPTEIIAVHFRFHAVVAAEHDTILILSKEIARLARLTPQFRLSSAKFDHHIGIVIEHFGHPRQVFRPAHVQRDKHRVRVPGEYAVPRVEERLETRKLFSIETPIGMFDQLLVSLVLRIDGKEERFGIAGMNKDRNAEASTFVENWIQTGIINRDELAALVADAKTKVLQEFQSARAPGDGVVELKHHLMAEIRVVDLRPIELSEYHETAGIGFDHG